MSRVFVALAALSLAACSPGGDVFIDDGYWMPESNAQGRMVGELPHIGNFDMDQATIARVDRETDWVWLELHTIDEDGRWGMVNASLSPQDVPANEDVHVDPWVAVGCSGDEYGWAEFDESPEDLVIRRDVIDTDDGREVTWNLRAVFADGDVVEGALQRPGGGR